MGKICRPLTDTYIKNIKGNGPKKHNDGHGLYLFISPTGSKLWRMAYKFNGKPNTASFGPYPMVSLQQARKKREEIATLLFQNIDPKGLDEKTQIQELTFRAITLEWFEKNELLWKTSHSSRIMARLEKWVFPHIGDWPMQNLKANDLLSVLNRLENQELIETAHRVAQYFSQIFRYSVIKGYVEYNVADNLRGALKKRKAKHFASVTDPKEVGGLLRAIDEYKGIYWITAALKLSPHVFVRPSELRCAEWSEFDFKKQEWVIPPDRMKMGQKHIVPLSDQALKIILDLQKISDSDKYLFPSLRTKTRPMSDNAILSALRRMGISKEEMTGHGFRSMASTLLNEQGVNSDWIERQLAHSERNKVRAAYNYAQFLPERRKMMQTWSDYLDELKNGNYEARICII